MLQCNAPVSALNYYRLEAGRFADFVSYGLEVLRSRSDYRKFVVTVTRLRTVLAPDVLRNRLVGHVAAGRHEVASRQKWRPQYCFWTCLNSIISLRDVLPLMYCMILLGDNVGGHDSSTCT